VDEEDGVNESDERGKAREKWIEPEKRGKE